MQIRYLFVDETSGFVQVDPVEFVHDVQVKIRDSQRDKCEFHDLVLLYAGTNLLEDIRMTDTRVKDGDTVTVVLKDRRRREHHPPDDIPTDYLGETDAKVLNFVYFVSFVIWSFSYVAYSNHPQYFDSFTIFMLKLFGLFWCFSFTSTFFRRS